MSLCFECVRWWISRHVEMTFHRANLPIDVTVMKDVRRVRDTRRGMLCTMLPAEFNTVKRAEIGLFAAGGVVVVGVVLVALPRPNAAGADPR